MRATLPLLKATDFPPIKRRSLTTIQANLGYKCNQSCLHCHVNAGPNRTEMMDRQTIEDLLQLIQNPSITTLDVTGGAPELNIHFRYLVRQAKQYGVRVIDRCNLSILFEPEQQDLSAFLAEHQVEVVASMPCYLEENVDAQRGNGVFQKSIAGLQQLNQLGYGQPHSGLLLNLVYNPQGPNLPPAQQALESDYKKHLKTHYGIVFNHLLTLANMPIQRFGSTLISKGQFSGYMDLLKDNYCADNLAGVMCLELISIDWQGYVYDCDFNQMLGLSASIHNKQRTHVRDLINLDISGEPIAVADHCYGCTAGQGSSCAGALN